MSDSRSTTNLPTGRLSLASRSLTVSIIILVVLIVILLPLPPPGRSAGTSRIVREEGGSVSSARRPTRGKVKATAETDPVPSRGDAADDPSVWVHPTDPSQSTIIGTDKRGGLAVYSLAGQLIQYLEDGLMVNVDVRDGFPLGGESVSLVTAGNRANHTIAVYAVDPATRTLRNVASRPIFVGVAVYGSCMYQSPVNGAFFAFVDSKKGRVEQWELFEDGGSKVDARLRRSFDVGTDVEGCVADDELGHLYISEEEVGLWKYAAEPDAPTDRRLVDGTAPNGHLTADVEGLTLYYGAKGTGYLIASSQGSDEFVVYRRENDNAYVLSFLVIEGNGVDAVTHTDGIDVVSSAMGPSFPSGLFVAQDDRNDGGNQNFKLVSWRHIEELLQQLPHSGGS